MSEIYIHYGSLEDSINRSQKVRSELSGYQEEIRKRITTPVSGLPGNDASGYASTASSLARQKATELGEKIRKFSSYESSVRSLISVARSKDDYVSNQIETITGMYIEERTWYQKAGDWIYNTFCIDLANRWDWTRDFCDAAKWVQDKIGNSVEKIKDWFKYGDGKYVLNIISAVGATVASIAVTIGAIIAIPFTGGATLPIVIGAIGAIAAGIGSIITVVNTVSTIKSNSKALSLSGDIFNDSDGNPGAARYYGNISRLSEEWDKTDMGNSQTNAFYEGAGKFIDTTEVVADTTAFVCNIVNSFGAIRDYRFKNPDAHIKGYSFTLKNLKHNLRGEFGFYLTKPGWQIKNMSKLIKTIDDFKDGIEFFGGQKEALEDIWTSDGSGSGGQSVASDPFDELGKAWKDITSPTKLYESLIKQVE